MNQTHKQIDRALSPALVAGGIRARAVLAALYRKHRRDADAKRFILTLAAWTGYPTK